MLVGSYKLLKLSWLSCFPASSLAKGYDSGPDSGAKGDPNRNPWLAKMVFQVRNKMQRFIDTCWVEHSLKKRRTDFTIEAVLYRPRLKFAVMPLKKWAKILCKFKKGVGKLIRYLWTEYCNATKDMADRTSVLLPSFSLPYFSWSRSILSPLHSFSFLMPLLSTTEYRWCPRFIPVELVGPVWNDTHDWSLILTWEIKIINQCCCSLLICFMYLRIMLACVHLAC